MINAVIEDHVARNSLVIYVLSGCTSIAAILLLVPRLFPTFARRLFQVRSTQKTSQNGLNRAGSTIALPSAPRRPISSTRMYLIVFSALLMVVDAINSCVMIASVWTSGTADWLEFHILRALSFFPAGPIMTVGLSQRLAVIAVMSPSWQMWFLRTVYLVCIWVSVQQQTFMIVGAMQMAARQGVSDKEWYDAFYIPQWSTAIVAIIPIITIGGSLWSLKIAFRHSTIKPTASSVGPSGSTTTEGAGDGAGTGSSSGGLTVTAPSSTLSPANAVAKESKDQLNMPASQSIENLSRTVVSGRQSTNQPAAHGQAGVAYSIKYALTTTFKILTYLMLFWWILFLIMITLRNAALPFRSSAMSSLLVSCALVTESSFEWLLKMRRKRQLHHSSRAVAAASRERLGPPSREAGASKEALNLSVGLPTAASPLARGGSVRVGASRDLLSLPPSLLGGAHDKLSQANKRGTEEFYRPSF